MSRRSRKRRSDSVAPRGRSIVTGQQMRDPFLDRSRSLARRFADEPSVHVFQTLRNLQTEDLRHEARFLSENYPTQTYRRVDGGAAHIAGREVHSSAMQKRRLPPRLRYEFTDPDRTLVCIRRKNRRRVIFALRKAGKAGKRNRKARWTAKSYITCGKGR